MPGRPEGPYDPQRSDGIDALCTSLRANGVKPGSNVFAELGSTWRFLMRDPDSAAHGLGKLFAFVGEDNVLWGTDSIWYGSPQDQIHAFRAFQISDDLAAKHGYPKITPALRAKVFGRNALRVYKVSDDALKQPCWRGAGGPPEADRPLQGSKRAEVLRDILERRVEALESRRDRQRGDRDDAGELPRRDQRARPDARGF